jgi:hypothetical protein
VVVALAASGKALEINELYRIPTGIHYPHEKRMRADAQKYVQAEN